jgi:hypothetical protein
MLTGIMAEERIPKQWCEPSNDGKSSSIGIHSWTKSHRRVQSYSRESTRNMRRHVKVGEGGIRFNWHNYRLDLVMYFEDHFIDRKMSRNRKNSSSFQYYDVQLFHKIKQYCGRMTQCVSHDELINDFIFKTMVALLQSMLLVIISVSTVFCTLRLKKEKDMDIVPTQTLVRTAINPQWSKYEKIDCHMLRNGHSISPYIERKSF